MTDERADARAAAGDGMRGRATAARPAEEVLASNRRGLRRQRWCSDVYAAAALAALINAVVSRDPVMIVGGGAMMLVGVSWTFTTNIASPADVVLTTEAVELRRPLRRSVRVLRRDVTAVHGSIAAHPDWSDSVIVETAAGSVRLPRLGSSPARVVVRLQEWADVDARPDGVAIHGESDHDG
ncbi:hypothetical protein IC607_03405 [Cellulomonas sp. JH27-2]|uniref:hypothetical protein n=1 Tax=Cellulomonas sp. JH27-2 TaxID=2774139 RepID=UPI0017861BD1|nr:hypothetical protein [Cellulomonas sp. JH27-2]MBD8058011.1 hypothetical protein [Cellulomonas sp. JH27-2]